MDRCALGRRSMRRLPIAFTVLLIAAPACFVHARDSFEIEIPSYEGIEVSVVKTMEIPGAVSTTAFRFADGRIVVAGDKDGDIWSSDGGLSWAKGPSGAVSSKT